MWYDGLFFVAGLLMASMAWVVILAKGKNDARREGLEEGYQNGLSQMKKWAVAADVAEYRICEPKSGTTNFYWLPPQKEKVSDEP